MLTNSQNSRRGFGQHDREAPRGKSRLHSLLGSAVIVRAQKIQQRNRGHRYAVEIRARLLLRGVLSLGLEIVRCRWNASDQRLPTVINETFDACERLIAPSASESK